MPTSTTVPSSNEIRKKFIDFFKEKTHSFIPSAPLVPQGDATLLFINSGMAQFKDIFLGNTPPTVKSACNSQKCIRLSGKHNDLDEVGFDTYHHTFFEMLGSWSFADYYKKEAISWAWELLCDVWKLPKDKLYATVYTDDDEAMDLWKRETDIAHSHIMKFGDKDNFWEMAETGPCGPCSEIHIDIGENSCTCSNDRAKAKCGVAGGGVNTGCGRYIEIWNLVFIQFYREANGKLTPLKNKYIDTGMGFERMVSVLQGKKSNYDTDVFSSLISAIDEMTKLDYHEEERTKSAKSVAFRVIVDHIRAVSFSIADGILPSNDGRGYVVRRLLRRAARYGRNLGLKKPFMHTLVAIVVKQMGDHFQEIVKNQNLVQKTILEEERLFSNTLDKGISRLETALKAIKETEEKCISGELAFELYDTYGFPLDLTLLIAKEKGFSVDEQGFGTQMLKQKTRSRADSKQKKQSMEEMSRTVLGNYRATTYLGDESDSLPSSPLIALFNISGDGENLTKLPVGEGYAVFAQTVFYGEGGGQIGDRGELLHDGKIVAEVTGTFKNGGVYFLRINALQEIALGESLEQVVNASVKTKIRKNHTGAHLLMQALVDVLGPHVQQAGSFLNEEKIRFDFTHPTSTKKQELLCVEKVVNEKILASIPVTIQEMPKTVALEKGARAFFEEKYGDTVRVVSISDYSIELCGGSHVGNTAELGFFTVTNETSIASGVRRIEAITANSFLQHYESQRKAIDIAMQSLSVTRSSDVGGKIKSLQQELAEAKKALIKYSLNEAVSTLKTSAKTIGEKKDCLFFAASFNNGDAKVLRSAADRLLNTDKKAVLLIANASKGKPSIFLGATGGMEKILDLRALAVEAGNIIEGSGGGKPTFAQAGGRNLAELANAYTKLNKMISSSF